MNPGLIRALYNLALPPALLAALPGSLIKMKRRGGYGRDFPQRLGLYRRDVSARLAELEKPCWLHAVSVGEVLVASKFIRALRHERPEVPVVLSTTTSTGHALARSEAGPDIPVLFNPLDLAGCVRRAMEAIRPGRLVLVEAEVWPNLIHTAKRWGLPVSLINARLSPRSERRFRLIRPLAAPIFASLDDVLVPDPEDVDRWTAIGVRPESVTVTGSLKHDHAAAPADPRTRVFGELLGNLWGHPVPPTLLVASTHPGEEAALARVFLSLRGEVPGLKLIVVPRHVERSAGVESELAGLGLAVVRRSRLRDAADAGGSRTMVGGPDALLIDTTGELRAWFPLAGVVVIGKSFLARGGQNPVEALAAGRPVVVGPHMENFESLMRSLRAHDAVIQVPGLEALDGELRGLMQVPARGEALVRRAGEVMARHRHAAVRAVRALFPSGAGGD